MKSNLKWVAYRKDTPDVLLFRTSSRTAILKALKDSPEGLWFAYKRNEIRIVEIIYEQPVESVKP